MSVLPLQLEAWPRQDLPEAWQQSPEPVEEQQWEPPGAAGAQSAAEPGVQYPKPGQIRRKERPESKQAKREPQRSPTDHSRNPRAAGPGRSKPLEPGSSSQHLRQHGQQMRGLPKPSKREPAPRGAA